MASKIVHALPRFPQSLKEILGGSVIGFGTCYVLLVPLSFLSMAVILFVVILLGINASSR